MNHGIACLCPECMTVHPDGIVTRHYSLKTPTRKGDSEFSEHGKSVGASVATENATDQLSSAVEILRDIAAMGKKAGSETAKNWLWSNGYALEEGGYIPGKGFECEVAV